MSTNYIHRDMDLIEKYIIAESIKNRNLDMKYLDVTVVDEIRMYFDEEIKKGIFSYSVIPDTGERVVDVTDILEYEDERFVLFCYILILGRIPGKNEVDKKLRDMKNSGLSKLSIAKYIAGSDEAKQKKVITIYPELDVSELLEEYDKEFVKKLYLYVLKRYPDEYGMNNYLNELRSGKSNRLDIINKVLNSAEAKQKKSSLILHNFDKEYEKLNRERKKYTIPIVGRFARGYYTLKNKLRKTEEVEKRINRLTDSLRMPL